MKYFFLAYALCALLVVGIGGFRGDKFSQPPIEVFPDMDRQDKVKAQSENALFPNAMGSRLPIAGTVPHAADGGVIPLEFSEGRTGYYFTGEMGETYGTGMPEELKLEDEPSANALLSRGEEMFAVHCAPCHGVSGNGKGVVAQYQGMAGIVADLTTEVVSKYPDGYIFHVITHGKGNMGSYRHNIPVHDRWAITAHLRRLEAN